MFIDAEDKESVAMFEYLCETNPTAEPYMLELMVWAYKHKHEEYEAIMEKYKDTENYINLDILKHTENKHVSAHIPENPENLPSKDGEMLEYNRYIQRLQAKEELNPEFETEMTIVN
jgi:hypothetical protein